MDSFAIRFWFFPPSAFHKQHNKTKKNCYACIISILIKHVIHFFPTNKLEKYSQNCFCLFLLVWNPLLKAH